MNYLKTAAVRGVLTVSLAASVLAGCGKHVNGTAAAVIVNGESINVGTANFILRYQQAETAQIMQMYGLTDGSVLWDTDISGSDEEETSDASSASSASSTSSTSSTSDASEAEEEKHYNTYGEQYKDTVLENIERMVVMRQHMADFGLSITDEQQAKIDEVAEAVYEANKDVVAELGSTEADINQVIELLSYEFIMQDAMLEDMDTEVSDEEAAQKTFTYARFATTTEDEESGESRDMTDEEKEAVEAKANELLRQIKAEDDIANVDIYSLATDLDDKATCMQTSFGADDTIFPDEVKEALETLKDGEVYDGVIETDGYYYVIRLDKEFDEEMTESKRKSILNTRKSEHMQNETQEWLDAAECETTEAWNALEVTDSRPYVVKDETAEEETEAVSTSSESETESTSEAASSAESESSTSSSDSSAE